MSLFKFWIPSIVYFLLDRNSLRYSILKSRYQDLNSRFLSYYLFANFQTSLIIRSNKVDGNIIYSYLIRGSYFYLLCYNIIIIAQSDIKILQFLIVKSNWNLLTESPTNHKNEANEKDTESNFIWSLNFRCAIFTK